MQLLNLFFTFFKLRLIKHIKKEGPLLKNKLLLALFLLFPITLVAQTNPEQKLNRFKIELGQQLVRQIESNPTNTELFQKIYNGKITPENIIDAMNEYKRSLEAFSRFDEYQKGNTKVLTAEEIRGYQLFNSYGCAVCHSGENFGGTQFKQLGMARNYAVERKTLLTPADLGLAQVTKNTKDFYVFRVPPLRNTAITYPYYHDGSIKSLNEAVYLMGKYQLGIEIPDSDVKAIVKFLDSLTAKSLEKQ
jgi:cytochrome c peroxidase